MREYFSQLTSNGKLRLIVATIITLPIRLILIIFCIMGRYAEFLNDVIDNYGKLFITWGRTQAQKDWENF